MAQIEFILLTQLQTFLTIDRPKCHKNHTSGVNYGKSIVFATVNDWALRTFIEIKCLTDF